MSNVIFLPSQMLFHSTVSTKSASRLIARCNKCEHVDSRNEFYVERPNGVPKFDDVCPRCKSNHVEVADPNHVRFV